MSLVLDSRFCGKVYIIECKGRIVAGEELSALEAALDRGLREFPRLLLCVSAVDRLDSTGMGLLMRYAASTRRRGGDLRLAAPPPFVSSLLNATKLSSVLQIYPTEEEALLSFLKERSPTEEPKSPGARVLLLDQSADLCAFVRTVLTQNGYDVQSTSRFRDARILLQVEEVEYILLGPHSSHQPLEVVRQSLQSLSPKANALHLGDDFHYRDAREAGEQLLLLLQQGAPAKTSSASSPD